MSATNNETLDPIVQQWAEQVRTAHDEKKPLQLQGSGSKSFYGHPTEGEPISLTAYQGVIDYEPSELVVTVKGGTSLAELEALLDSKKQFLPFEPPHFGPDATVAGCIASGLAGPRRAQVGGVRDFVLGVKVIDGQGRALTFGGQVMKNVAGYDVSRLLTGSMGTLAIMTELSIKVLPKPVKEITLKLELDQAQALQKLNHWGGQPIPISASAWFDEQLYLRLSGAPSALSTAQEIIQGSLLEAEPAQQLWQQIREQTHTWFKQSADKGSTDGADASAASQGGLWRLSVPSTAAPILPDLPQLIEWGGALRWCYSDLPAAEIRSQVEAVGGTATLFRSARNELGVFHALDPVVLGIQQRLKQKFDPAGIFNPGRIYPGEL